MRVLALLLLALVATSAWAASSQRVTTHGRGREARRHHHHQSVSEEQRGVQVLAQTDEDVEENKDDKPSHTPPNPMACQQLGGQTICLPSSEMEKVRSSMPPSDPHAQVMELEQQLSAQQEASRNAVALASQMVKEVRDETHTMLDEARNEAAILHEENSLLRTEITELETQLRTLADGKAGGVPDAPTDQRAALQVALQEYEELRKQYEAED